MPRPVAADVPLAVVGGRLATDLVDLTDDLAALDVAPGFWAVVLPVRGRADLRPLRQRPAGPPVARAAVARAGRRRVDAARSSEAEFKAGVRSIRASIAAGDVYQVNLTRRLSAPHAAGRRRGRAGRRARRGQPGAVQRRRPRSRRRGAWWRRRRRSGSSGATATVVESAPDQGHRARRRAASPPRTGPRT